MRYFIVGRPIQYLESGIFQRIKVKSFSKETLISEAWEAQNNLVKIFDNYAHALAYARSLRQFDKRLSVTQTIEKNLAAPIFTLEFQVTLILGESKYEDIHYPAFNLEQMLNQKIAYYWIQPTDYLVSIITNIELPDTEVQEIDSTTVLSSLFSKSDNIKQLLLTDNNTESTKSYLDSPKEKRFYSENAKLLALHELKNDLKACTDINQIYPMYKKIISLPNSMLRFQRKNLLQEYGDTDSYIQAIKMIYIRCQAVIKEPTKATALSETTKYRSYTTFIEWTYYKEITMEYFRLRGITKEDLHAMKIGAYKALMADLSDITGLPKVLELFELVRQPQNILRLHRKNVWNEYGDTDSYKKAIYHLGAEAKRTFLHTDYERDKEALHALIAELTRCAPKHDHTWEKIINELTSFTTSKEVTKNYQTNTIG